MSNKLPKRNQPPTPASHIEKRIEVSKKEVLFMGPLPDPETLQKYEEIYPGMAERIIAMTEKEQGKRHENIDKTIEIERRHQRSLNLNVRMGLFLAFGSVLVTSGMCCYFAYLGNIDAASDTAKWVIASLAAVFITGRIAPQKISKD